jgi:hypothetical protein
MASATGEAHRIIFIWTAGLDSAKGTRTGANISKDHKVYSTTTFTHIRTIATLANGMQVISIHQVADLLYIPRWAI